MTWDVIERLGYNMIPYSEDWTQWSGDVTKTGQIITDSSTSVSRQLFLSGTTLLDDPSEIKTRCLSVTIAKDSIPAATRYAQIRIVYSVGSNTNAGASVLRIDTSTGEVLAAATNATTVDYGIEDNGDNWRAWIASMFEGSIYRIQVYPSPGKTSLSTANSVTVTGSITLVNAQFEEADSPSIYTPTTGIPKHWVIV